MGPYGLWLLAVSAGQRGGECYTLAVNVEMGPVFRSNSSQMPLYSVPPSSFHPPVHLPHFPPPINDPFVKVFLPRWAGEPQQDQTPRLVESLEMLSPCSPSYAGSTSRGSLPAKLSSLSLLRYLSYLLLTTYLHTYSALTICPHLTSRLVDF